MTLRDNLFLELKSIGTLKIAELRFALEKLKGINLFAAPNNSFNIYRCPEFSVQLLRSEHCNVVGIGNTSDGAQRNLFPQCCGSISSMYYSCSFVLRTGYHATFER